MTEFKGDEAVSLRRVLDDGLLRPLFQPILDFRLRAVFAYEAQICGPEEGALPSAGVMFAEARRLGIEMEFEQACHLACYRAFVAKNQPGRLFVKLSVAGLLQPPTMNIFAPAEMSELGILPNRVVLQLSLDHGINENFSEVLAAVAKLRGRGFQFSVEALGDSLNPRLWSELRPEFVKIDKRFVQGVADDRMSAQLVRAVQDLAKICSAALLADGVERVEDFNFLRDMGIACAQGSFAAMPAEFPSATLSRAASRALAAPRVLPVPIGLQAGRIPTVRKLLLLVEPIDAESSNAMVIDRFEADPDLDVLPVVRGGKPCGMINRYSLIDRFARAFRRDLYGTESCELFMDPAPLIVDHQTPVQELAGLLPVVPRHYLFDGFVITEEGRYLGVGSGHDLLATIAEMQLSAARYANPLTRLPGNVPISEHIDRLLVAGNAFVIAYFDIDNFKPYNDTYGYPRGDEMIQLLGRLAGEVVDPRCDFVGHAGADDFFLIYQSADWEMRCWQLVHLFAEALETVLGEEERAQGGYLAENRRGDFILQALPTLSVGVVRVGAGDCESHREVLAAAASAKKQAKKGAGIPNVDRGGGCVFVDRRRPGAIDGGNPVRRSLN